ncbi:apolipoprotein D-like [Chanos chanos]|uniref:Apolipoprotein D n=1 Tax=Chanos chanos TaxID=29144 RepID=A0A6J2UWI2_CHACN|nr:apolipoprotein D-like [Chanos chanos]
MEKKNGPGEIIRGRRVSGSGEEEKVMEENVTATKPRRKPASQDRVFIITLSRSSSAHDCRKIWMEGKMLFLCLVLIILGAAQAQSFHFGKCPKPPVQQDFQLSRYLGTWYEIEKLPAFFERGKCQQATYTQQSDSAIKVVNKEILNNGEVNSIEGTARVINASEPAILEVSFFAGLPNVLQPDAPYWVLSTDYTNYALVYSCTEFLGFFYVDFAWILSRSRSLPAGDLTRLRSDLQSDGITITRMTRSDQTGCGALM